MADDTLYSLLIRVQGGDAAAAEIVKSRYALKDVQTESNNLEATFQKGFQHIALRGFIADAARSVGLGTELRPVISILNMGISGMGAALGLAAGPVGLIVTGLAAVAGMGVIVYNHFKKHAEALEDVASKAASALASTDALKDAFARELAEVGKLPAALDTAKAAMDRLDASQRSSLIGTEKELLAANQKKILANQDQIDSIQKLADANRKYLDLNKQAGNDISLYTQKLAEHQVQIYQLKQANSDLSDTNRKIIADIVAQMKGHADARAMSESLTKAHQDQIKAAKDAQKASHELADTIRNELAKATEEEAKDEEERVASLEKSINAESRLNERTKMLADDAAEATKSSYDKQMAAIQKFRDQQLAFIDEEYAKGKAAAQGDADQIVAIEKAKDNAITALDAATSAKSRQNYTETQEVATKVADSIENAIGNALAKTIVEGKNLSDSMKEMSKQVSEQIISDLVRIAIQAAITKEAIAAIFI